jgi:outer membrane protein OmpA-like peptidoglycan-associated protein
VVVTVEPPPPPPPPPPAPPPEPAPVEAAPEPDDPKPSEEPSVSVARSRIELADPIFFARDRKRIRSRYWDELDQLARVLNRRPEITTIVIEGHADATGPESWNLELSRLRAAEVAKYLTKRHVDPARLKPVGWGEAKPLVATPRGQENEANRRVHFYTEQKPPAPPTEAGPRAEVQP